MTLQNPMTDTGSLAAQLSHVSASLVFSPDGELLVSGAHGPFWSGDSTIKIWNTLDWEPLTVLHGHIDGVYSLDFNSEGTLLASAGSDGVIRLWGVPDGD
jgi:WD40 repeat protein